MTDFANRVPPSNFEAEQSVLGSLLLDPNSFTKVNELLNSSDFYEDEHKLIFIAIERLFSEKTPIDILTVSNLLTETNQIEKVGGVSYLTTLVNEVPHASHIVHYANIVRKKSFLRKLIDQTSKVLEASYAEKEDVEQLLEHANQRISAVSDEFNHTHPASGPGSEIIRIQDAADRMEQARGGVDRFPIGYSMFTQIMDNGVSEGDLVIISGKSGHGKTTFAQTISYYLNGLGLPQLWFSYEMQITEIWNKFKAMGVTNDFVGFCPLNLKSGNVDFIERKINEGVAEQNIKAVFIDHLGFLNPKINEKNAKEFEYNYSAYLGQLVRQLKRLAIEKKIIIFLLAHVRKTKEELDIDDIAHSIGIAQEADFVFMVERERLKSRQKWGNSDTGQGDIFTEFSKIMLVKNRRTGINKFIKCKMVRGRLVEVVNSSPSSENLDQIIG